MALVNLIADIEKALAEKFDVSIALADEKAMSVKILLTKMSPSLTDAVIERMPS